MSRAALRESVLNPCPRIKSFPGEMNENKFIRAENLSGIKLISLLFNLERLAVHGTI